MAEKKDNFVSKVRARLSTMNKRGIKATEALQTIMARIGVNALVEDIVGHSAACIAIHAPAGSVITLSPGTFLSWPPSSLISPTGQV